MRADIKDVAKMANVSISTVSKYMNGGNLREPYREKVKEAIEKLHYEPSQIAMGFRNAKSFTIGILQPSLVDQFCSSVTSGISRQLEKFGYGLITADYNGDSGLFRQKVKFLLQKKIEGVFVFPEGLKREDFAALVKENIPIVALDRPVEGLSTDMVSCDHFAAGYFIGRQLIEAGRLDPLVMCSLRGVYTSNERRNGFLQAYRESGLEIGEENIVYMDGGGDFNPAVLAREIASYSAVFSVNFHVTLQALAYLNHKRVHIPEDLTLACVDSFDMLKVLVPGLVCYEQPIADIAREACRIIRLRVQKQEHPLVAAYLGGNANPDDGTQNRD